MSTHESIATSSSDVLPWLSCVERQSELTDVTPGEYVLRTLFSEFTILTDRKIEHVLAEPLVSSRKSVHYLITLSQCAV